MNKWNKAGGNKSGETVTDVECRHPVNGLSLDPRFPGLNSLHPFSTTGPRLVIHHHRRPCNPYIIVIILCLFFAPGGIDPKG